MPQYISLAQQGFWQPYQQLGEAAARYSDRKDRKKERQQDIDWRNTRRDDELSQQGRQNSRQDKLDKLHLDTGTFALDEAKKKHGQQAALENFNINSLSSPEQPVAPGFQGPPAPAIKLDMNLPFSAQPPEVQDNLLKYAKDNFLPFQQLTSAFQQQQSAMTGRTPMPAAPAGMVAKEYEKDGVKFGLPVQEIPDIYVDPNSGDRWQRFTDGTPPKLLPESRKTSEKSLSQSEADRFRAIQVARSQIKQLEELLKGRTGGPGIGHVRHAFSGMSPVANNVEALTAAMLPNLAKGVLGDSGAISDMAQMLYGKSLPDLKSTEAVRTASITQLTRLLDDSEAGLIDTLAKAGRDVSSFTAEKQQRSDQARQAIGALPNIPLEGQNAPRLAPISTGGGNLPRFNSEAEARAAGLRPAAPGQPVAIVFDPVTGRDRPWAP